MKASRCLFALPFVAAGLWAAAPAVSEVSLPERVLPQLDAILRSAVQQSPRMLSRSLDLEIAENSRTVARAGLLPTASAGYSYYKSSDQIRNVVSGPAGGSTVNSYMVTKTPYSLSISQPVYFWGERTNNDRIGAMQLKISQGQYREAYRLLAQELRTAYLRLIAQKLAVKRARFYLDFTTNQLKQQEERLTKKVISEVEISVARLTAEQAQIAMERADFDYQNARLSFARLAGLNGMADEAVPDSIPAVAYTPGPFDTLLAGFLAQKDPPSTEALTLHQTLAIEELNYANQRTRLRPKLSAVGGVSQDEQNNLYGTGQRYSLTSVYAGLSINWTIFDGFATGASARISLARRHQLENDYRQLTERLAQDAQIQAKQINFSARNMSIYERLQTSADGYLKTVQGDFARGLKSEADVSQTQLNAYDAQINALNARTDYLLRTGDFLGLIMEDPIVANLPEK